MLKNIATAPCKSQASYNRDHIVPDLIPAMFEKRSKCRLIKRNIIIKNVVLTKSRFADSNF